MCTRELLCKKYLSTVEGIGSDTRVKEMATNVPLLKEVGSQSAGLRVLVVVTSTCTAKWLAKLCTEDEGNGRQVKTI